MAIITKDEPSLVREPRPRILSEKIVGNMIDIKNEISISAKTDAFPPRKNTAIKSKMLIIA